MATVATSTFVVLGGAPPDPLPSPTFVCAPTPPEAAAVAARLDASEEPAAVAAAALPEIEATVLKTVAGASEPQSPPERFLAPSAFTPTPKASILCISYNEYPRREGN